jgi:predicted Zn-dependent protease
MDYDWNYPEARKRLQTALTLAPTDPVVLDRAANFLLVTGRPEQALEIVRWLRDRDPLNSSALAQLAGALSDSGQLEAAEHTYRELLEQRPGMSVVHSAIGNVRVLRGDPAGALAEYEKESNPIVRQCGLPLAYAGLGREQEARALLGELSRQHPDWAICIAEGYAYMGDVDAAFKALDVGVRERDPAMKQLRSSPFLKPLYEDSRWGELLETMGLSDKQVAALPLEVKLPQ